MRHDGRTFSCNLRIGDSLFIEGGRIVIHLEAKSGQQARVRLEMVDHIEVERRPAAPVPKQLEGSLPR